MFNQVLVNVYEYTEQPDSLGLGIVKTFTELKNVKGYFDYISGSDKFIQDKFKNDTTHIFIVLGKKEELNTEQYIHFEGNFYQILLVDYPVQAKQTEVLLKFLGDELDG